MKSLKIFLLIISLLTGQLIMAQNKEINDITISYYNIKNALVADDGKMANTAAEIFLKRIETLSNCSINATQEKVWKEHKSKLIAAGEAISKTTDIAKQRAHLNQLSISLFAILKAFKSDGGTVYYQYCPMKKAHWLSSEKDIKNPYYGKKMLTCGSEKEILR